MDVLVQNAWRIGLKTCLALKVGYFENEKKAAQEVEIDVNVFCPFEKIKTPLCIENIVDYDFIFNSVQTLKTLPHHDFLEDFVIHLMAILFQNKKIDSVQIKMHKKHIYQGLAEPVVALHLSRENWQKKHATFL